MQGLFRHVALAALALSFGVGCSVETSSSEELGQTAAAQSSFFLYFRCNATGWGVDDNTRMEETSIGLSAEWLGNRPSILRTRAQRARRGARWRPPERTAAGGRRAFPGPVPRARQLSCHRELLAGSTADPGRAPVAASAARPAMLRRRRCARCRAWLARRMRQPFWRTVR
jgi:hypothetical protein